MRPHARLACVGAAGAVLGRGPRLRPLGKGLPGTRARRLLSVHIRCAGTQPGARCVNARTRTDAAGGSTLPLRAGAPRAPAHAPCARSRVDAGSREEGRTREGRGWKWQSEFH